MFTEVKKALVQFGAEVEHLASILKFLGSLFESLKCVRIL